MNPVILTPVYRYFEPEYLDSCEKIGVAKLRQRGSACIHEARDLLVYQAIQAGFDILLFIDSDIAFEPADVDKVLKMCDETKGVVVGTYCSKAPPHAPIGFVVKDGIYAGMGFTAIHKEALLKIILGLDLSPLLKVSESWPNTKCLRWFQYLQSNTFHM